MPGQAAGLELRHRQHARVEDRIREAKATGLRNEVRVDQDVVEPVVPPPDT